MLKLLLTSLSCLCPTRMRFICVRASSVSCIISCMCLYCSGEKSSLPFFRRLMVRAMLKLASPILSISLISLSMARTLSLVSSERWASLTWSRYLAISISILSDMPSYFSILEKSFVNLSVSFSSSSSSTMWNILCMRVAKECISFCASSTESSGVFMMPAWMKRRRKSSSSLFALGFQTQQHTLAICLTNGRRIIVLVTLKHVWKAAKAKLRRTALCLAECGSSPTIEHTKSTNG